MTSDLTWVCLYYRESTLDNIQKIYFGNSLSLPSYTQAQSHELDIIPLDTASNVELWIGCQSITELIQTDTVTPWGSLRSLIRLRGG